MAVHPWQVSVHPRLALMDGGVPIKAPVAGVAMGLIKDEANDKIAVLTDIQGMEDFLGRYGLQSGRHERRASRPFRWTLRSKESSREVLERALAQALDGRLFILDKMMETISAPRESL